MKKLHCLYVSRYAPNRTRTDPYTGLPWYLCEKTSLVGLWGRTGRPAPFENYCEKVIEANSNWWGILSNFLAVWQLRRECNRPDVVVCGIDEYSLTVGIFAGKVVHAPVFCIVEDPPFTNRYCGEIGWWRNQERRIRRLVLKILLNFCSGIFCFIEKDVLDGFKLANIPIYQLMNGVSPQALEWIKGRSNEKNDLPECKIGYVGAINLEKGIEDLLESFSEAKGRVPNLYLRLIGPIDHAHIQNYQVRVADLGLNSNVEITGWLPYEKMLEKLLECDIGVYCNPPDEWFRFAQPLKICEYLALEKPTVAWDYPGTRRMLDHGRYGILVSPGNRPAFANALVSLVDPTARRLIKKEIHVAIQGHWSSDYWYSRVLNILSSLRKD